jgi:hypothetical protein
MGLVRDGQTVALYASTRGRCTREKVELVLYPSYHLSMNRTISTHRYQDPLAQYIRTIISMLCRSYNIFDFEKQVSANGSI